MSTPTRNRPRSVDSSDAILAATLELLAEHGFDGTTTDAIAARAGVSKATIYRRWASKDDLVLAAVTTLARDVADPDTGRLADDLRALLNGLVTAFSDERVARLVPTIVDQMARKPAFADAMRQGFVQPRRETARRIIQRARDRGEVAVDDGTIDHALDMIAAPLYYRVLITGEPVDARLGEDITTSVLTYLR